LPMVSYFTPMSNFIRIIEVKMPFESPKMTLDSFGFYLYK
jgi:hypothetical protein